MTNLTPLDELIRALKVARSDLSYAENEEAHYTLNDMATTIDNCLYDLTEAYGGDGSAFRGANAVAMEIALSDMDMDIYWNSSGEVENLDPEWDESGW
jgi:hypothetical protein